MDSVFLLGVEPRRRFLQYACRILGCSYICLWSPLYNLPSKNLSCIEGWFDDNGHRPSSLPSSGSLAARFFDSYCGYVCSTENGCVPGLVFKGGLPYLELVDSDLMKFATIPIQRQFYQEAGIKTALFMGCSSGEIELGTKNLKINIDVSIQQVFSLDFIQKFQLADTVAAVSATTYHNRSSSTSSSSSLRSLTPVGSPDGSQYRASQLPAPMRDDDVLTKAILAVISGTPSFSALTSNYQQMQQDQAYQRQIEAVNGAFKAYDSSRPPNLGAGQSLYGQRMIKMSIDILRRIRMMKRMEAPLMEEVRPAGNQLQHMISERKRREKINDSFLALRMLLPPGSKKDKVSVLVNTKNYLISLLSQISDHQERNRILEGRRLLQPDPETSPDFRREEMQIQTSDHQEGEGAAGDHRSTEQVQVHVSTMPESTSEAILINLGLRVMMEECDITVLVLRVLECLKEMRNTSLISVNADTSSSQANPIATLNLRLQIRASDWDEESFKEAVTRAGNLVLMNRNP